MGYAEGKVDAVEKQKSLDSFESGLIGQIERLELIINRVDDIAIRFRGTVPKSENEGKEIPKAMHKLDDLARLLNRLNKDLSVLDLLVGDLQQI